MCEPTTIGLVTTGLSTAFSVYSGIQEGKAAKSTAEYNARVAENEAQTTRNTATEQENIQRQKVAQVLGTQRAQLGAAGIELGSGSALQMQTDTIDLGEVDALRIRSQGDDKYRSLMESANLSTIQGNNAYISGLAKAGGSLLSGVGSVLGTGVADKWFTKTSAITPYTSNSNPFGLTSGQGL